MTEQQERRAKPLPSSVGRGTPGAKLWREITKRYDLRLDELAVLEEIARERNIIDAIEDAWAENPRFLVKGSTGQDVANPLLGEMRQHRAVYARLLGSLRLPDEVGMSNGRKGASAAGRSLALRRHGATG